MVGRRILHILSENISDISRNVYRLNLDGTKIYNSILFVKRRKHNVYIARRLAVFVL